MFFKYLALSIRHNLPKYLLLVGSLIACIVAALTANGILVNSLGRVSSGSSYIEARFRRQNISEVMDELNEFLNVTKPDFKNVCITPAIPRKYIQPEDPREPDYAYLEEYAKVYGNASIWLFPSYEEMKRYLKNVQGVSESNFPTKEQYENERVVILGREGEYQTAEEPHETVTVPYVYTDEDHVLINGEEFLVVGKCSSYYTYIFGAGITKNMLMNRLYISFDELPTIEQVDDMVARFTETMGSITEIREPRTRELLEERKNAANIGTTAIIQLIVIFNVLIIYRYIVESRKRQFAVMRFCGFKKSACLRYMWGEIFLLSMICLPIACGIFEAIRPSLAKAFPLISVMFSPGYYTFLSLMFLLAATAAFAAYIVPSFGKTISRELLER